MHLPSSVPPASTSVSLPQATHPDSMRDKETITPTTPPGQSETVSISEAGQEINQYTEAIAKLPDIREERIAQIQAALESGTYSVSSQDLADKLIQELST